MRPLYMSRLHIWKHFSKHSEMSKFCCASKKGDRRQSDQASHAKDKGPPQDSTGRKEEKGPDHDYEVARFLLQS